MTQNGQTAVGDVHVGNDRIQTRALKQERRGPELPPQQGEIGLPLPDTLHGTCPEPSQRQSCRAETITSPLGRLHNQPMSSQSLQGAVNGRFFC